MPPTDPTPAVPPPTADDLARDLVEDYHEFQIRTPSKGAAIRRAAHAEDKAAAGERFKAFVHTYLDSHGVPHGDPENQHQREGCRIGARLDLLFAERDRLRESHRRACHAENEVARLRAVCRDLMDASSEAAYDAAVAQAEEALHGR